jgi:hypothetical protein
MPSNLNALIRYKQIDKCLRNKYVNCTIEKMQKMCSEQLSEHRGVYKLVSERTIRDDIKTMRGDSLGFNAKIVVKDGVYNYEDESFSIFNSSIDDMDLLKKVMMILLEEKENISNPNLDSVLDKLSKKTGIALPTEYDKEYLTLDMLEKVVTNHARYSIKLHDEIASSKNLGILSSKLYTDEKPSHLYSWKAILELL